MNKSIFILTASLMLAGLPAIGMAQTGEPDSTSLNPATTASDTSQVLATVYATFQFAIGQTAITTGKQGRENYFTFLVATCPPGTTYVGGFDIDTQYPQLQNTLCPGGTKANGYGYNVIWGYSGTGQYGPQQISTFMSCAVTLQGWFPIDFVEPYLSTSSTVNGGSAITGTIDLGSNYSYNINYMNNYPTLTSNSVPVPGYQIPNCSTSSCSYQAQSLTVNCPPM